jgi:hypothetical protein
MQKKGRKEQESRDKRGRPRHSFAPLGRDTVKVVGVISTAMMIQL